MKARNTKAIGLLVLFTTLNLFNFVDRFLLKAFANEIIVDLDLSYFQFSLLTGLVFSLFYAGAGVVMGVLADHFSRIRIIASGATIWSLLTAATGVSVSFVQVALARAFIGIGESALMPSALSVLKDVFAQRHLSKVTAIYYLGVPVGTGFSLIVSGMLGPWLGWRGTFILLGALGAAIALPVFLIREPRRHNADQGQTPKKLNIGAVSRQLWDTLKRIPALRYLIIASILMQFSLGGDAAELVWLVRERGFTEGDAQLIFGGIYLAFGTFALLLGGWIADWFARKWRAGRIIAFLGSALFLLPMIAFRLIAPDQPMFFVLATLSSMFASLTIGPYYASVQDLSPSHMRATILATVLLITYCLGVSLGSALFGYLSDLLITMDVREPLTVSLTILNSVGLLSVPFILLAIRHFPEQQQKLQAPTPTSAAPSR